MLTKATCQSTCANCMPPTAVVRKPTCLIPRLLVAQSTTELKKRIKTEKQAFTMAIFGIFQVLQYWYNFPNSFPLSANQGTLATTALFNLDRGPLLHTSKAIDVQRRCSSSVPTLPIPWQHSNALGILSCLPTQNPDSCPWLDCLSLTLFFFSSILFFDDVYLVN